MKTLLPLLLLSCFAGLWACQKPVDSIPIPYTPKIVVEAYHITNDATIRVSLRTNQPMVGSSDASIITDATVTISDGQQTVTLPFHGDDYWIGTLTNAKIRLRAGTTYTLKASAPGYESIEATCTIPTRAANLRWRIDGIEYIQDNRGYRVYNNYLLVWGGNIPTERQYFALGRQWAYADTLQTISGQDSVFNGIQTVWDHFETDDVIRNNRLYARTFMGRISERDSTIRNPRSTDLLVMQFDVNAYNFLKASQLQKQSGNNPFAEPSLVPSNIKNGLGVFGAVYQRRQTVP